MQGGHAVQERCVVSTVARESRVTDEISQIQMLSPSLVVSGAKTRRSRGKCMLCKLFC